MTPSRLVVFIFVSLLFALTSPALEVHDGINNLPAFGSFGGSDFDIVSLQNGNLHIHIPLGSWPQCGGKNFAA